MSRRTPEVDTTPDVRVEAPGPWLLALRCAGTVVYSGPQDQVVREQLRPSIAHVMRGRHCGSNRSAPPEFVEGYQRFVGVVDVAEGDHAAPAGGGGTIAEAPRFRLDLAEP